MNNAQTAAKLIEYADRCIAAYDAADPSDRSVATKRALSECFHEFSSLKPMQLGSREKVIFSLDNNPKRHSVLKHVRNARSDIPVDTFIMKFAMPEIISEKTKEDNTRAAAVLQQGKFGVSDTKAFHEKMKELANKLITKEIVNLKLAKFVLNYTAALRINESSAGIREYVPVRSDTAWTTMFSRSQVVQRCRRVRRHAQHMRNSPCSPARSQTDCSTSFSNRRHPWTR